jgi:hypothetical protein
MQKNTILVVVLLLFAHFSFSQKSDTAKKITHFSGSVSVTNNGLSLVPTFSLGEPAALVNLSIGGKKFSFEPDMRFALEGKPWSFRFWARYKLLKTEKFAITLGSHPALNFKTITSAVDARETIVVRRFLAGELSPNYFFTKNISIGVYYVYAYGFDQGTPKNNHFVTLNSNFSNIKLPFNFLISVIPQFYYLKQDEQDGYYFTSEFHLAKKNFPLSVSSIINKPIESNIIGGQEFVWNISLIYSFNKKQYIEK